MTTIKPHTSLPGHVAIIMDGNGRWATARGLRRSRGHRAGVEAAKRIVLESIAIGIDQLTLYAFSTENWTRSKQEVTFLMGLVARHLRTEYDFYRQNNVRVRHIGCLSGLPAEVQREIERVTTDTADNTAITVNLAINYGGRDEIVRAVNRWVDARDPGEHLCEAELRSYLDLGEASDPDLLIRTGGEQRISNFLLWQCAYAELAFSPRLWPDWDGGDLRRAVDDFRRRKRNFGGTPIPPPERDPLRGADALQGVSSS
ncbi:MAG TPA: polyprenyl diphosphate synthase [Spirochaetia bacterium]|nr:polyprenyl diphosphate synthase [Spirochaetia bacterium]